MKMNFVRNAQNLVLKNTEYQTFQKKKHRYAQAYNHLSGKELLCKKQEAFLVYFSV